MGATAPIRKCFACLWLDMVLWIVKGSVRKHFILCKSHSCIVKWSRGCLIKNTIASLVQYRKIACLKWHVDWKCSRDTFFKCSLGQEVFKVSLTYHLRHILLAIKRKPTKFYGTSCIFIQRVDKKRVILVDIVITSLKSIRKGKSWCVLKNSA